MYNVESNKYYIFVCVCACVLPGACAYACVCVHIAFLLQHVTRMRHVVTSFVALWSPPLFATLSIQRHDFRKKCY
jgi:hypothetical protein